MTEILQEIKSPYSPRCSTVSPVNPGYNETAFVMQILLQARRQDLRHWIRLHRPIKRQSHYRPGQALMFPGRLRLQDFKTIGT
jgi:hypothetical protein